jgi:hypothetical protein
MEKEMKMSDLEMMMPGHTDDRVNSLTRLKQDLKREGIETKDITQNDIECFWLTTETGEKISHELFEDLKYLNELHLLKQS